MDSSSPLFIHPITHEEEAPFIDSMDFLSPDSDVSSTSVAVNKTVEPVGIDSTTALPDILTQHPEIQTLTEWLQLGGPVVWILAIFSIIATALILLKVWQFIKLRPESYSDVQKSLALWKQGEYEAAQLQLKKKRPVSAVVSFAMTGLHDASQNKLLLQEEIQRLASAYINQLRTYLRPLEVIANLSPLLGLLGTVLGMIVAFQQMADAGSQVDPSMLSGGIWQALLTTAVGLCVAIPVVAIHSWLDRKTERIALLMNDAVTQVFTHQVLPRTPVLAEVTQRAA